MDDYRTAKKMLFNTYLSPHGTAIISINNDEWINFVSAAKGLNRDLILVGNKNIHSEIQNKFAQYFYLDFLYL